MAQQLICKGCGQPIRGNYLSALGATWHPEHFVCASCGRPINTARFQVHEGKPYHSECFSNQIAPRCAYCNKPLVGEYLIDHWGTQFCAEHKDQYPRCAYCGRLVPPHDREPGAETVRCTICRGAAIETKEQAQPLFRQVVQWVNGQGLRYNNLPIHLELCGRATLAKYMQGRDLPDALGATAGKFYTENGRIVRAEVSGVAILLGLPSTLFRGVVAHELGHVWFVTQSIQRVPSWAEEGFCELLAYRYYSELNTPESRYHAEAIERNPDPVYGNGFRQVRTLADSIGFQRLIEVLSTAKQLPGIYP
jgi:hypothetical protein